VAVSRSPTPQDSRPADSSGGLDVSTLIITAIASAGAALVSSELLGSGTLVSAALTPVVIALIKEALDRPRRVVSTRVPAAVARPRRRGHAGARDGAGTHAADQADEAASAEEVVPGGPGEVHVYRSTSRRWRLAIVTGLLGFALAAAVLTVTELAAGGAVSGGSRATTYFGGSDTGSDAGGRERSQDTPPAGSESSGAPSTTPDPSATTPEDPASPGDAPQDTVPSTPADPAAPTPPAQSAPAPAPESPAPAPGTPAPAPDAPAAPAP